LNGTNRLLVCDDVNAFGEGINTIKESTESILHDSKKFGLEVNTEKSMCKEFYLLGYDAV
jgi:hypothetical protein